MLKNEEMLRDAVTRGDRDEVRALVSEALAAEADPFEVLNRGLLPAMEVVGQRFAAKTIFLTEVLLTARAMHAGLDLLRPCLLEAQGAIGQRHIVVLGTVRGDLHDIGKNLVAMMLEAAGFEVVDLGTNVATETFIQAVQDRRPSVVALSALLTTTMRQMRQTIEALRKAGAMDGVKAIVGGAPVTQEFADAIGADGYAPDAAEAVVRVKRLLGVA